MMEPEPKPKRPRGDGRIFARGKILWCSFYVAGREQRESCHTDDPKRAEKYLRARVKDAHAHERKPEIPFITARDAKRTIPQLMDAYWIHLVLKDKGSEQNRYTIERVKQDFPGYALALTKEALGEYMQQRLQDGYSNATVNRWLQALRAAYRVAEIPSPRFTLLNERGNVRKGFFEPWEVRAVLSYLPADLSDFIRGLWLTGMRRGELSGLTWADLDDGLLILRADQTKNGHSRTVPLEGELKELITQRATQQNGSLIFHREGKRIREFRKAWATACRKAGVPGRRVHDLRRSAIRDAIRAGVQQAVAMSISGHRSPAVFQRYNITAAEDQRQAMRSTAEYRKTKAVPQVVGIPVALTDKIGHSHGQLDLERVKGTIGNA